MMKNFCLLPNDVGHTGFDEKKSKMEYNHDDDDDLMGEKVGWLP